MQIKTSELLLSFGLGNPFPEEQYDCVAVVGKSNVGKSSLINSLANRKGLARTSSAPGKTRLINYFIINGRFCLVDLPGYGYAKVSKAEKEKWGVLIENYLEHTRRLRHIFLLMDIRHNPTADDMTMLNYVIYYNIPYTIIATKADKIAKSKRHAAVSAIRKHISPATPEIITYSTIGRTAGRDLLLDKIAGVLGIEDTSAIS